jgi:hypothetical protein
MSGSEIITVLQRLLAYYQIRIQGEALTVPEQAAYNDALRILGKYKQSNYGE